MRKCSGLSEASARSLRVRKKGVVRVPRVVFTSISRSRRKNRKNARRAESLREIVGIGRLEQRLGAAARLEPDQRSQRRRRGQPSSHFVPNR